MLKYIKVPKDTYDSMILLMAELKEDNRDLELERLNLERALQTKRETISRLQIELDGGPVEITAEDDLPDFDE